jgi:hypothetical protein
MDEYLPALAACLREAGFEAEVRTDGALEYNYGSEDQRPAFEEAQAGCYSSLGVPPAPEPLTEVEIRAQYHSLLSVRSCLMELGYAISEPPSEDVFVETWASGGWSPYDDIVNVRQETWDDLNRRCPQT